MLREILEYSRFVATLLLQNPAIVRCRSSDTPANEWKIWKWTCVHVCIASSHNTRQLTNVGKQPAQVVLIVCETSNFY